MTPRRLASAATILLFWCAIWSRAAEAPPRFRHLTARDGLASNWIRSILRDSRGFLWVGTQNGLSRYDGISVRTYRYVPGGNPRVLPFPVAGVLHEDRQGRLWIGSSWGATGVAYYDWETDTFTTLPHGPGSGGLSGSSVEAIIEANDGKLWIGVEGAVDLLDPNTGRFDSYRLPPPAIGGAAPNVQALVLDANGRLWIGANPGLYYRDPGREDPCRRWQAPRPEPASPENSVVMDLLERDGTMWVATLQDGLFELDLAAGDVRHFRHQSRNATTLPTDRLRCLAWTDEGLLWVGTENGGLALFEPRTGEARTYRPDTSQVDSINSASIWALHADDQGILWVGTYSGGVNELSPLAQRFMLIRAGDQRLSDPHVEAVIEDRAHNLWIGTDGGGLNRIDGRTGRFSYFRHDPDDARTIGSDSVAAIAESDDGMIWVGGWDSGLCRLDPRTGRVTRFRHRPGDPRSIIVDHVWAIVCLKTGEMLVATQGGADLFDPRTKEFSRLSDAYPGFPSVYVFSTIETPQGDLWLGSANSVYRIDRRSGAVTTFRHDFTESESLGRGVVADIRVDSAGNTWFATESGLNCLPAGSGSMRRYTPEDGLPNETVTNILEDAAGSLWIATNRGLSKLVDAIHLPDPLEVISFDEIDGLQGPEFGRSASFRSATGRLYFGGQSGLNAFYPAEIRRNEQAPPVALTGLRVFNKLVVPGEPGSPLKTAITDAKEITLSPDDSTVTFEFAALNLLLSEKNHFSYRLEDFEESWNNVGTQRTATYTKLPHGQYVFRVRASNSDGVWNNKGAAIRVIVLPRWYERHAVHLLLLLALSAAIYTAHRQRVRYLSSREQELTRRVAQRTADLNALNAELERRVASRTLELESEKERLAVTLRSIGDGVIAADIDGRISLMNRVAEQLTGWTLDEARSRPLQEVFAVVDRDTRKPLANLTKRVVSTREIQQLSIRSLLVRRDGREVQIADSVAPIRDQDSRIVGVVVVFRDVSERLRMEEQIQNTQKLEALGILAGGIAHDFNNLLTGIFGHIDLAQKRLPGAHKALDSLKKALSVLEKARGLTGQLLTFSHAGQPERVPVALGTLIEESVRFALSGSNATCEIDLPEDLWLCRGDARQIDQVIDNLLLNARQAMPKGGMIRVGAVNVVVPSDLRVPVEPGRYVRVMIRDDGPGIPPDLRGRVFEPFFTTKANGTGLGLTTSYSIIRKHGGHIDFDSPDSGQGVCFSVYLPAAEDQIDEPAEARTEVARGEGRILVLDDEQYVREVAGEMLEGLGYSVRTVSAAEEAVKAVAAALASAAPFDLAILDLTLPGGPGGVEVLGRLRALQPTLRAIASSGYSVDMVMTDPEKYGFDARLTKPYTTVELSEVVSRILSAHRP